MRQFTLINANGETYNITEVKKSFFHSVKGLGFGEENTYQRVGNRFVMLSNRKKQRDKWKLTGKKEPIELDFMEVKMSLQTT